MATHTSHNAALRSVRLRLTGATSLRDGQMQQRSVAIEDGRISKGPLPEVDLSGYYILPGIVDVHGAAFDRFRGTLPRVCDPTTILAAAESEAAANGVTTAWLGQSWSWEGGAADPAEAQRMLALHNAYVTTRALLDLRVSILCETHTVESRDALLSAIRRYRVDLVLFTNRLATLQGHGPAEGPRPGDIAARMRRAAEETRDVPRHLCRLAEGFDTLGVTYGSLDDPDGERRETYSMIGAKLCVRPARRSAAALARAVGDPVLLPAPAILNAGVSPFDTAAIDYVRHGLCNALVSDRAPAALAQSAFALSDSGIVSLAQAWGLISAAPAAILGLPDRGTIDYGRRADLAIVNAATHAVEATIVAGRIAHLAGAAAERFLSSRAEVALAAE
ncbi:Alpha-D-ribose 1-methylphosphonate 5-triphosphate diphosphatase [Roseivivax jejudonensis]|uniref:Alpha-D-ribose 1-methylphosphonate 5-triphosphate diphosphatase n=1 Tax=Roseivivax jejudonensis TaxID=1529041 RepID=A0A1X6ZSH7_9RHOB|nr:alkylphosphonate utilization protein [Roseivivax jejudonensis]SLN60061.1 Alpha-D-ribose 1-methylphosphonate 5-triphosphate diphosphatase [Roseivivax jejudonensis]